MASEMSDRNKDEEEEEEKEEETGTKMTTETDSDTFHGFSSQEEQASIQGWIISFIDSYP